MLLFEICRAATKAPGLFFVDIIASDRQLDNDNDNNNHGFPLVFHLGTRLVATLIVAVLGVAITKNDAGDKSD